VALKRVPTEPLSAVYMKFPSPVNGLITAISVPDSPYDSDGRMLSDVDISKAISNRQNAVIFLGITPLLLL
jgi:hypothetical protein